MKGPFKKFRKKRCKDCKYLFNKGIIYCCQRCGYLEGIKIICFKKEERCNEDNK